MGFIYSNLDIYKSELVSLAIGKQKRETGFGREQFIRILNQIWNGPDELLPENIYFSLLNTKTNMIDYLECKHLLCSLWLGETPSSFSEM